MKIVKKILLFLLVIIVLLLIVGLFVPKVMKSEKEIVINKPKQQIFDYIKSLKNQNNFSKWAKMDPEMKQSMRGTDGAVGSVNSWEGNSKVGKGEQEVTKIDDGKRVDFELRFEKPMKSTSTAYITTETITDSTTKVKWGYEGKIPYPFNVMNTFGTMTKLIGDDFSTGLANLKQQMEATK